MKKTLLSLSLITVALAGKAQCSDLFISKYVSMGANNKCIEIYNPTANAIVMTNNYYVARYKTPTSSGNVSGPIPSFPNFNDTVWLKGTIPAYGTWVMCNPETTPSTSNNNSVCNPALRAHANQLTNFYGTYGSTTGDPMYFKGSDAITLEKKVGTTSVIVDLFGRFTDYMASSTGKPSAWSTISPFTGGVGEGTWITKGYMMVRKPSVINGVTSNPSAFNPLLQYDTIAKPTVLADTLATWNKLGSHTCNCKVTTVKELTNNAVSVSLFPNPMSNENNTLTIKSSMAIKSIFIYDIEGKFIAEKNANSIDKTVELKNLSLSPGIYVVKVYHSNGQVGVSRFSKL